MGLFELLLAKIGLPVANGIFKSMNKDNFLNSFINTFESAKKDYRKKYSSESFSDSFLGRRENEENLKTWIENRNIFDKKKPDLNLQNFDGTIATEEQVDFFFTRLEYHIKGDEFLKSYVGFEVLKDTHDKLEEQLSRITDSHEIIELLNKYINAGKFEIVLEIMSIIENNDVKTNIDIKLNFYFNNNFELDKSLKLIGKIKDSWIENDTLAFLILMHYENIDNIKKIQNYCNELDLKILVELILNKKVGSLFEEIRSQKNDVEYIEYKINYCTDKYISIQNRLIFNVIHMNAHIFNLSEICQELLMEYNFHNKFLVLNMQVLEIVIFGDAYKYNGKKEELELIFNQMMDLEDAYKLCSNILKEAYYASVFEVSQILDKSIIIEKYMGFASEMKENPRMKAIYFEELINKELINKDLIKDENIIEFCVSQDNFNLLAHYFANTKNESIVVCDFFEEHKYLLKKNTNLLEIYFNNLLENKEKTDCIRNLKEYELIFENNLHYYTILIKMTEEYNLIEIICERILINDITIDNIWILMNFKKLCIHGEKIDEILPVLEKYSNYWIIKFSLLELQYHYNKEALDKIEVSIDELISKKFICPEIFELKARILIEGGYDLEALNNYIRAFHLDKSRENIIKNIIVLSINNQKKLEMEVLQAGLIFENSQMCFLVGEGFKYLNDYENYVINITKSLLMVNNNEKEIFNAYIRYILSKPEKTIRIIQVERVDGAATVLMKNENENEKIICLYENKKMIPVKGSRFGNATHLYLKDKIAIELFRKKIGDLVIIDDEVWKIDTLLDTEAFLFQFCLKMSEENKDIKIGHIDEKNPEQLVKFISQMMPDVNELDSIIDLYNNPIDGIKISFNMIFTKLNGTYSDIIGFIYEDNRFLIWNINNEHFIEEKEKILISHSAVMLLYLLDINIDEITKKSNLYIESVTKKMSQNEYDQLFNELNKDIVSSIYKKENQLFRNELSEEEKGFKLKNATEVNAFIKEIPHLENESDLLCIKEISILDIKKLIGLEDYNLISLAKNRDATIITEDAFIVILCKSLNINVKTCGIIDLLIYLDIDCILFIEKLYKLAEYSFRIPISYNAIEYISKKTIDCCDANKKNIIIEKFREIVTFKNYSDDYGEIYKNNISKIYLKIVQSEIEIQSDILKVLHDTFFYNNEDLVKQTLKNLFE
ncbi:MAG TPA: hypothetical protein VIK86_01635 [Candidatus Paceibacterota bacterium]